jgi:hypothetical protein
MKRKTEDNFAPESTHGILNTNRRQFFFFRNSILQQAIEKASTKIEQKYNSDLSIRKATFDGFSGSLTEIQVPKNADTLFSVQK